MSDVREPALAIMRGEQRHLSYGVIRYRVALSSKSGHTNNRMTSSRSILASETTKGALT
jgi:hypothetical protein